MPRRDDVRRLGQPRPRRLASGSSTPRSTPASTSSTPPTSTRAASRRRSSARRSPGRRDDVVLATKVHGTMGDDPNQRGNSRRWIIREVEDSLRRLEHRLHRPLPDPPPRARRPTSTRRSARSPTSSARARSATSAPRRSPRREIVEAQWVAERPRARALRVRAAAVLDARARRSRPTCCRRASRYGMGVIPWSPLAGGWLIGQVAQGPGRRRDSRARAAHAGALRPVDARRTSASSTPPTRSRSSPTRPGMSLIHLALAFVHQPPGGHRGDHRAADDGAARVASSARPRWC